MTEPGVLRWLPRTVAALDDVRRPERFAQQLVFDDPVLQPGHEPTVQAAARPRAGQFVY